MTTDRLTAFARNTNPLVTQLRPAARELSPTLLDLRGLAPDLKGLFRDLGPLITVSRARHPGGEQFLRDTRPLLRQLDPFLRDLNPILDWLGLYKREIAAFFALDVAATQAVDRPPGASGPVHYLRTANPINPEILAAYPRRLQTNRSNPYVEPGGYENHPNKVFGAYACGTAAVPPLAPPGSLPPNPIDIPLPPNVPGCPIDPNNVVDQLSGNLRGLIDKYVYNDGNPGAPPCQEQAPLGRLVGQSGKYPHVLEDPSR